MLFRACLFFALVLHTVSVFAQNTSVVIKGTVVDVKNTPLSNATISISNSKGILRKHFNAGHSTKFSIVLKDLLTDTLILRASSIGYGVCFDTVPIKGRDTVSVTLVLPFKENQLEEVVVKAPPIWVRGDTTFYSVEAFREGDERKLKDILNKMPGFEINDQGQLLFKRKPVEKITIEGEEIFADKMSMLINSFPTHVLERIEAIENQSNNKLLKGLTNEKRVFLNLTLNKSKLQLAFGDTETGLGTRGRYNFAPVVFSLLQANKFGFIGNWNSIGSGQGYQKFKELKTISETEFDPILMDNRSLTLINNFDNSLYLKNRQWDNRLQWNMPLSSRIKSQSELSYVSDRIQQKTFNNLSLYTQDNYIHRLDTNQQTYRPEIVVGRQSFAFNIDTLQEFKFDLSFSLDRSGSNRLSWFDYSDSVRQLESRIRNKWDSYSATATYTKRISPTQANSLELRLNTQLLNQEGQGNSKHFPEIFEFNNDTYTQLTHKIDHSLSQLEAVWTTLGKNSKGGITNAGISYKYSGLRFANSSRLSSANLSLPEYSIVDNHPHRSYLDQSILGNYTFSFKLVKNNFAVVTMKGGLSAFSTPTNDTKLDPLFRIDAYSQHSVGNMTGRLTLAVEQKRSPWEHLLEQYYAVNINSFTRTSNPQGLERVLNANYGLSWNWDGPASNGSLVIRYDRKFINTLSNSFYENFMQYNTISVSRIPTSQLAVYTGQQIPSLLLNSLFDLSLTYSMSTQLMQINDKVENVPFSFQSAYLALKKNWNRIYFIRSSVQYLSFGNKINRYLPSRVVPRSTNLNLSLYQRLVINSRWSVNSTNSYYKANLRTSNVVDFLMSDFEISAKPTKKPIFFSIKVENLFNEKNYYNFLNGGQVQSFNTIPLLGRTAYGSVTFNF